MPFSPLDLLNRVSRSFGVRAIVEEGVVVKGVLVLARIPDLQSQEHRLIHGGIDPRRPVEAILTASPFAELTISG